MELQCPNKECNWTWNYHGKRTYPAWVTCPNCLGRVKIPKNTDQDQTPKCVFANRNCIHPHDEHDGCRNCKYVPDMICENDIEVQYKYLCGIAGQRDKCEEYYGSIGSESPDWFMEIIKATHGQTGVETCFDHVRTLNKKLVVSEPYDLHIEDFRNLIKFCDDNNLSFVVDGDAAWFPGRTFRIIFTKKYDQEGAQ